MLVFVLFLVFTIPKENYYTVPSRPQVLVGELDDENTLQNPYYGRVHSVFKYNNPSEYPNTCS
jgi:hypothetical protein